MNISGVQTQLSSDDLISIINEFVKVEGLEIENIILDNSIDVYGKYISKFSISFEVSIEILSIKNGIIKGKFSKCKISGFGFFRPVRSLALKYINKKLQEIGINTDVYKDLRKKHVARVIPPIKKTNVILKNTNFQYAMKLWDYLQSHVANDTKEDKESKNYEDNGIIKEYFNDAFYLSYLALETLNKKSLNKYEEKEAIEEITDKLIERIVELNVDLDESILKEKIGQKIAITKYKKQASLSEIQSIFSRSIKNYLEKIENFKF